MYLSKWGLDLFWSSSIRWKVFTRLKYFYFFPKAFLRVWWKYDLTSKQNFYSVQINLALFVLTLSVQKVFLLRTFGTFRKVKSPSKARLPHSSFQKWPNLFGIGFPNGTKFSQRRQSRLTKISFQRGKIKAAVLRRKSWAHSLDAFR